MGMTSLESTKYTFKKQVIPMNWFRTQTNEENLLMISTQVRVCQVASVVSDFVWLYGPQPARLLCPWDSPGKNTGEGFHFLLQGIFPIQGWKLCLFPALAGRFFTTRAVWEAHSIQVVKHIKQNKNNTKENHRPISML